MSRKQPPPSQPKAPASSLRGTASTTLDEEMEAGSSLDDCDTWVGPIEHARRSDRFTLRAVLRVVGGMDAVLFTVLAPGQSIVIGRAEDADLSLRNITVSRRHARVVCGPRGEVSVTDLGSRNGTFINDRAIESEVLIPGQRVNVGAVALRLDLLEDSEIEHLEGLRKRLDQKVETDPLTGLGTRVFLESPLPSYVDFHLSEGRQVSCVFLDVDEFKTINDNLNHQVGDEVLRVIARKLEYTARNTDFAIRYGGDEFVVFLFNSSLEGAANFAERLRYRVERHPWDSVASGLRVTCSFGVAEVRSGEAITSWIRRADEALLAAKKKGRNRVERSTGR